MNKRTKTSYMQDTSIEMQEFQYNLIMSKTPEERFRMGLEMIEFGREMMLFGIRNQKPGLSEEEERIELLKRLILYDKSLSWLKYQIPQLQK